MVPPSPASVRNYDKVAELVAAKVAKTAGQISAKRLLPAASRPGMQGRTATSGGWSPMRSGPGATVRPSAGGRRPAIWSPGEVLAIDWGEEILGPEGPRVLRGADLVEVPVRPVRPR